MTLTPEQLARIKANNDAIQARHDAAHMNPRGQRERQFHELHRVCQEAVVMQGDDGYAREGVAYLLEGFRVLLNMPWGDRFNMSIESAQIREWATAIGYDLDMSTFTDPFTPKEV